MVRRQNILYSLFFLNLAVIISIWLSGSSSLFHAGFGYILLALGRLCGLLTANFVLLQLLLIGRIKWIEPYFGHDKLTQLHKLNGKYGIFTFLVLHLCLITLSYSITSNTNVVAQTLDFFFHWEDLSNAYFAFILFIGVIGLSITIVRRRLAYEFWYITHLLVYLAILFAWGHQLTWGGDFTSKFSVVYWYCLYIFVCGNLAWFRFIKPWLIFFKHQFRIEKIVKETSEVTSIYITGKNMESFRVQPGQFFIFRFLDKKRWWQTHPFSLSRPTNGKDIRISVKNSGDFTSDIASIKVGTYVYIDGPHGVFTQIVAHKNKFLLIAGGIGITPLRSLLEQLAQEKKNIILLYSNKTITTKVFAKELTNLQKEYPFTMIDIMTQQNSWKGEAGRMNGEKIIKLVPDYKQREIYLCGPIPMMDAIRFDLKKLGVKKENIHYEKFEL